MSSFNLRKKSDIEDTHEEPLSGFLQEPGGPFVSAYSGEEKLKNREGNIEVYDSQFGMLRYVYRMDGKIIGAIQMQESKRGREASLTITNVFVDLSFRRQGIATELFNKIKNDHKNWKIYYSKFVEGHGEDLRKSWGLEKEESFNLNKIKTAQIKTDENGNVIENPSDEWNYDMFFGETNRIKGYHGTDKNFDEFEIKPGIRRVLFSEFEVTSQGFFFTEDKGTAKEYGKNIHEVLLDLRNPFLDTKNFSHLGINRLPGYKEEELEYILEPMIETDENGLRYMDIGIGRVDIKDNDDDWIYSAVGSNGLKWDVLDNEGSVLRMRELGYDGTYVDEPNDDIGQSIFVVDQSQIIPIKQSFNLNKIKTASRFYHQTSPENALNIQDKGFTLDNFGQGAGLGMAEEPMGIFLSIDNDDSFEKEVENRNLPFKEKIEVELPDNINIWRPTNEERLNEYKKFELSFIKEMLKDKNYQGDMEEASYWLQRGAPKKVKDMGLIDVLDYLWSVQGEFGMKKGFSQYLQSIGYDALEWREPVYGVNQLLVFDPSIIKPIKKSFNLNKIKTANTKPIHYFPQYANDFMLWTTKVKRLLIGLGWKSDDAEKIAWNQMKGSYMDHLSPEEAVDQFRDGESSIKIANFNLKLFKTAKDAIKELYHGTILEKTEDILLNGLKIGRDVDGTSDKAEVFLTSSLETALNYATWEERTGNKEDFIVFDVYVPAKYTNNLRYDEMDRFNNAWFEDSDNYDSPEYNFDNEIKEMAREMLETMYPGRHIGSEHFNIREFDQSTDLDGKAKGKNLYKVFFNDFFRLKGIPETKENREIIKSVISNKIGDFIGGEYIYVAEDGSLIVDNNYWNDREQLAYSKNVLPQMIKGVYVNHKIFNNINGTITSVRPKMIPPQASYYYELAERFLNDIYLKFDAVFSRSEDIDDLRYSFENNIYDKAKELDKVSVDMAGDEIITEIENMKNYLDSLNDISEIDQDMVEELSNTIQNSLSFINESHGQDYYGEERELVYVPVNNLAKKEELINLVKNYLKSKIGTDNIPE